MTMPYILEVLGIALIMMMSQTVSGQGASEAERVWELAIKAKGGREALYKVHNILAQSTSQSRTTSGRAYQREETALIALPDKVWTFTDERPEVFGEFVIMLNYENMTEYMGPKGGAEILTKAIPANGRPLKAYQNMAIFHLMESRGLKPKLLGAKDGTLGKEKVLIVQTDVDGRRVDFALNRDTYLPAKITTYDTGTDGVTRANELQLSNYVEIDGIRVARTAKYNKFGTRNLTIRFNVDYDPSIFVRAPTKLSPDAWKPKGQD